MVLFRGIRVSCLLMFLCPLFTQAADTGPVGVNKLEQFDQLSEIHTGTRPYQASSYDRNGGNSDCNQYLDIEGEEKVMLNVEGPGCVYRIWFTAENFQTDGIIRIYFDGSDTPAVEMTFTDFFSGNFTPFVKPLVGNQNDSSGGYYCYVPMPFRSGCKITSTNAAGKNYYNITYHRYADAEGVTTFTGNESVSQVQGIWNATGTDPKPDTGQETLTGTINVPANGSVTLADIQSPGIIQEIEFDVPAMSDSLAYDLHLRAIWDDQFPAAVDAPFGPFFGAGLFEYSSEVFTTVDALPAGISNDETRYYSYFPMPFDNHAQLELANNGDSQVDNVSYTMRYTTLAEPQTGIGKFHALFNHDPHPATGEDYIFLEETGAGHLVGIVQTWRGYSGNQGYLEGDERIFIDGSDTPALHGTGAEDFYNGGWYFSYDRFTQPVHGMPIEYNLTVSPDYHNTCYRYLFSDTIPFTNSIRAGMEHGGSNEYDVDIDSLALYYKIDQPLSVLTDELDVGDAASESAHGYTASNVTWSGTTTAPYEVDLDGINNVDQGNWLGAGGTCQFTMTIVRGRSIRQRLARARQ